MTAKPEMRSKWPSPVSTTAPLLHGVCGYPDVVHGNRRAGAPQLRS